MRKFFIALFLVLTFLATKTSAATINEIVVSGNKRVETSTIEAFLALEKGKNITKDEIDNAFRRTFETGLFEDLTLNVEGDKLIVDVKENPVVSEVAVDGNDKISKEKILAELKISPRSVFKQSDLQADVTRILTLYQRSGRYNVNVKPSIEKLDNNRVKVVYVVNEGERAEISQITFINNKAFDEAELENEVTTKESRWWRFLSGNDNYDPDRVEYDKELLRRYYTSHGYADFEVVSTDAEFNPVTKSFNIIFTLKEGLNYSFGKIDIKNNIKDFNNDLLAEVVKSKEGKEFNSQKIDDSISALTDKLGDKGYAFVKIVPNIDKDKKAHKINLTYEISEGPRVYVNNINIKGNSRTTDEVVRREFRLAEGDPYNASKIKRSKQRIEGLGFFSKVDIKNETTDFPDKVDLAVAVEEQSTGELTFGTGFSSQDGVLGDISIVERNLLGKGQFAKLNLTAATSRKEIDLSFTEPYFLDRNLNAGFDIFHTILTGNNFSNNLSFDSTSTGVTFRGGYQLSEYVTHNVRYTVRNDKIANPQAGSSLYVTQQLGERITSGVGHTISYNTLDNQFFPHTGIISSISEDYAGLGGDVNYIRHEAKISYFNSLSEDNDDWILRLTSKGGNITGLGGKNVFINDRFFIGGNVIRGFQNQGLGPRDKNTRDPLGAKNYYAGTAELMFPLGLPNELQVKGAVFADAGSAFGTDIIGSSSNVQDNSALRGSVGFGVFWRSPVGPIRIDFSNPFLSQSYDRKETIRFNFGTRF
jgi:outer membrane protein insertion porin family